MASPLANPEIERSIAIYRGHDRAAKRVIEFLETVPPGVRRYAAVDFDPAGLVIANSLKVDAILVPAHLDTIVLDNRINKEAAFNSQYKPELRDGLPESWKTLWDWMVKHRAPSLKRLCWRTIGVCIHCSVNLDV